MSIAARGSTCDSLCGGASEFKSECESFDEWSDDKNVVCGEFDKILELCSDMQQCSGVWQHTSDDVYYFGVSDGAQELAPSSEWIAHEKMFGAPCTDASDFNRHIGHHHATDNIQVGVDHVFSDAIDLHVEVHSQSSRFACADTSGTAPCSLRNRIMVIPCTGTCGKTEPVVHDVNWYQLSATNSFDDEAAARRLTDVNSKLSFGPFNITEGGGRHKLCVCDAHLQDTIDPTQNHNACTELSDFNIEMGYIHVSGIHCLLQNGYNQGQCSPLDSGDGLHCQKDQR